MKRLIPIVFAVVALLALSAVPVSAAEQLDKFNETCVIKCPEGYGHLVLHINGKVMLFDDGSIKFDCHVQGQMLLKVDDPGSEVWKCNEKIVCNGQAGEDGVFNGQFMIRTPCGDFHVIVHFANGKGGCKVVPPLPPP